MRPAALTGLIKPGKLTATAATYSLQPMSRSRQGKGYKELQFFNTWPARNTSEFLSMWPPHELRAMRDGSSRKFLFDATPEYLLNAAVPPRMKQMVPQAKIVIVLRVRPRPPPCPPARPPCMRDVRLPPLHTRTHTPISMHVDVSTWKLIAACTHVIGLWPMMPCWASQQPNSSAPK